MAGRVWGRRQFARVMRAPGALLARFARDRRAGIAVTFGFALIPTVSLMGAAVDYSRTTNYRTELQSVVDMASLMVSKDASRLSQEVLEARARDYINAMFSHEGVQINSLSISYATDGGTRVDVSVDATVQTVFMQLIGVDYMNINAMTQTRWGSTRLRVALVLDNTGSMASSGKMAALKQASTGLLSTLESSASLPEDVYVSIIPFSKDVNVGTANVNANWLRWDLHGRNVTTGSGRNRVTTWQPYDRSTWTGCVTDRDQSNDVNATAPVAGTTATLFPAERYADCPVALMPLSNDWDALNAKIDSMIPVGNTNQTIGLQWGMQSLIASAPLAVPPKAADFVYQDAIVLLTDGMNTQNRWSTSQSTIDARTRAACNNAKAAGIIIYSVQVNTGSDPQSSMLRDCASDPSKYFYLTSSTQILAAFDAIGTSMSQLRLSQ